ncbi:response regulator, partial [Salmonella enterica]|uniref:response regulator n=1 Tax=Salmonella enterica TaxID=28901 RepID=UPI0020C243DC
PDDCIRQHKIEQIVENDSTGKNLPSVLVVDDNADVRKYLRMILSERYHVMEATDGKSGLTLALENVPDIVVSDVMMPVMDGLEFCKRLKTD